MDNELTITITLVPLGAPRPVDVRFRGASDVRFLGERTALTEIVLLTVEDISSSGWEAINFRVEDSEEEVISLVCREIDVAQSDETGTT